MKRLLILSLLVACPLRAQGKFNVMTYGGAVCDGVTNDTAAVQKTINDAAAIVNAGGSPGPIYFPPSAHPCKVGTITFPSVNKGWLYSLFDNGLFANHINVGSFNSFNGRGGMWQTGTLFPYGVKTSWVSQSYASDKPTGQTEFVDLNGVGNIFFNNIGIDVGYSPQIALHKHGWGVQVKLYECGIGGRFVVEQGGFNLRIIDSTILANRAGGAALSITDFGYVTVRGGYLQSVSINSKQASPFLDGYIFDDLLSEGLANDWLTINAKVSNLTLTNIRMADPIKPVYLVKNNSKTTGTITIRNCGWNDGWPLVNPASAHEGLSGVIESLGARATYEQSKLAFAWGQFCSVQGPCIFYAQGNFTNALGPAMQVRP